MPHIDMFLHEVSAYLSVVMRSDVITLLKRSNDVKNPRGSQNFPTVFVWPYRFANEGAITSTEARTPLSDRLMIAK